MTWHFGIDEAGYGPNLGPLVQFAVGFEREGDFVCPWELLGDVVRRADRSRDQRLTIDDSKKVYAPPDKLKALELGVLATLLPCETSWPISLESLLKFLAPEALVELAAEPWFDGQELVPVAVEPTQLVERATRLAAARTAARCSRFQAIGRVTPPALFNALLSERDNKADVLSNGLHWLLRESQRRNAESIAFAIDRQGGRKYHAALLQSACPEGWIEIVEETESRCRYRTASPRELSWAFEVEADARHFTVALASMAAKYVREVLMGQFNRYWQRHVPGLKPTAGYPVDAARFYAEIRPAMQRLGIDQRAVWRRK